MRKINLFIGMVLTTVLLAACGQHNKPEFKGDISGENDLEQTQSYFTNGMHEVTKCPTGYYYMSEQEMAGVNLLKYYDNEEQKSIVLCNKPQCEHNSKECMAYLDMSEYKPKIYYYNSFIYMIRMNGDLEQISADGSERIGNKLTKTQLQSHEKLKTRDLALLTLMLGTGIRVSECVGLDINDVDFDNDRIRVIRKGGSESFVYFGDEVREALLNYLEERKNLTPDEGHENALFISAKKKRLCVRSVELLVKKYAQTVTTVKHITPHKLRSTYGTNLYQESQDIYLVADVLGHKDVNTTRKHYAEIVEENKRSARNIVKLRKD